MAYCDAWTLHRPPAKYRLMYADDFKRQIFDLRAQRHVTAVLANLREATQHEGALSTMSEAEVFVALTADYMNKVCGTSAGILCVVSRL